MAEMRGRVLIIAGSDSGGGAGIQADIKTVTALGGFAMTAITALTAQNTQGVEGIYEVDPAFIVDQIRVVMTDLGADCIKIGMLHATPVIVSVAEALDRFAPDVPVVVDPVMVAKGGASLLQDAAVKSLREVIVPRATVLTPNVPEAEALSGQTITTDDDVRAIGGALLTLGPKAVLLKGGHRPGPVVRDVLMTDAGSETIFENPRIETAHTHGTGCTLASAVASGLAQGLTANEAVGRAGKYVHAAIASAPGYGSGHGPLNHAHTITVL